MASNADFKDIQELIWPMIRMSFDNAKKKDSRGYLRRWYRKQIKSLRGCSPDEFLIEILPAKHHPSGNHSNQPAINHGREVVNLNSLLNVKLREFKANSLDWLLFGGVNKIPISKKLLRNVDVPKIVEDKPPSLPLIINKKIRGLARHWVNKQPSIPCTRASQSRVN